MNDQTKMNDERLADIKNFFIQGDDYDLELWNAIKAGSNESQA